MESAKYFAEITTQKAEEYLKVWEMKTWIHMLVCSPYTKKFSTWVCKVCTHGWWEMMVGGGGGRAIFQKVYIGGT